MPEVIQFKNGNQIKNSYDAAGKKLGEEYFTQLTTLPVPIDTSAVRNVSYAASVIDQSGYAYVGNYEYNTSHGDATLTNLNRIYTDEGYIQNSKYYYFRRDHLSDNHEVWCADSSKVVQRTQYYPSGLPWAYNTGDNPGLQRKKYNNQAFIEMHGYDTYDIEWRQYYPGIMKFQTPDPEIEDYYAISPYTMCGDNMVIITDPNGRSIWSKLAKLVLKGGNTAASFASVCQDIKTIVNGEGSTLDQVTAVGSLASELLPVSLSDAKDGIQLVENVVQDAKAAKKAEQLAKNAAKGKEFEKASKSELIKNGHKEVVDQVTIKTSAGRTRMDHVSTKDGKIHLREDKSSRTAKLSRNQRKVHEALKKEGGIVVGNNGGQAYPSGTKIPPSEVEINRPK